MNPYADLFPAADPTEDQAFAAFNHLKDADDFAPEGSTLAQVNTAALSSLRAYTTSRRAKSLPLFPAQTARVNKDRNTYFKNLFTKEPAEFLEGDSLAAYEENAKLATNPHGYRATAAVQTFLNATAGQEIAPDRFEFVRDTYARQHLNLSEDTSDTAVFNAIQDRYHQHDATGKTITTLGTKIYQEALKGDGRDNAFSFRQQAKDAGVSEDFLDSAVEQLQTAHQSAAALRRKVQRITRPILTSVAIDNSLERDEDMQAQPGDENIPNNAVWEGALMISKLPEKERNAALYLISESVLNASPEEQGTFARMGEQLFKGAKSLFDGGIEAAEALAFTASASAAGIKPEDSPKFAEEDLKTQLRAALRGAYSATPMFQPGDSYLQMGAVATSSQIANFAAVFSGGPGLGLLASSMGGQSFSNQRLSTPEADVTTQALTATASGIGQAAIETYLTKAGAKLVMGRVPALGGIFTRTGIKNPLARSAIALPVATAAATAVEFTEEIAQDALDNSLSDLANVLSEVDPATDWNEFFQSWTSVNRKTEEMFFSIVPFALIGSGAVASYRHFKHGQFLQQATPIMREMEFSPGAINDIQNANPEEAASLTREEFQRVQTRQQADLANLPATALIDPAAATAENRNAVMDSIKDASDLSRKAGFPLIEEEFNEFTEENQWTLRIPEQPSQVFDTEEDAAAAYQQWELNQQEADLEVINDAAMAELQEFLTEEDTLTAGTIVTERNFEATPARAIKEGIATLEQFTNRAEIFALQEGSTTPTADLRIMARRFATVSRQGVYRGTVEYFKGANPLNILEDFSETAFDKGLEMGMHDGISLLADLRKVQETTGQAYVADDYVYSSADRGALLEGLSKLAVEYAIGNVKAENFPAKLRRWLQYIIALAGNTFRHAQTVARSENLMGKIKEGRIDQDFLDLIADSVGLNPKERAIRGQHLANEAAAAQGLDIFEEIAVSLKGKLPHPDTLEKASHPLAGEIRDLHSNLRTATRKRNKRGQTIFNSQKADNYFLPKGEQADLDKVRESLNEDGFSFDTPADMVSALVDSLSYGIQTHATGNIEETSSFQNGNSSFSLATPGSYPTTSGPSYSIGLSAIHNLSARNLDFADKMGGLAVPSIAIVPTGQPISGFGDITLIGGKPLGDPSLHPIFDADAYTARFPSPEYKTVPMKVAQKKVTEMRPFVDKYDSNRWALDALWDYSVNNAKPDQIVTTLKRETSMKALFLSIKGITPIEPNIIPKRTGLEFSDTFAFKELINTSLNLNARYDDIETRKEIAHYIERAIEELYEAKTLPPEAKQRLMELTKERYLSDEYGIALDTDSKIIEAKNAIGKTEIDATLTEEAISKQLEGMEGEFYSWVENYAMEMFDRPRIKVGRRWEPYTLDSIVAVMTKRGTRNKEEGLTFSEGSMRAMASRQFKDLEEMRNAAKLGIKSESEVEKLREGLSKRMETWRESLFPSYRYDDTWAALDSTMEAMGRYLKGRRTRARFKAALDNAGFINFSDSIVKEGMELADDFIKTPVPYFEAKPQRVVQLSEFDSAVIPFDTAPETLAILEKHGIPYETLEKGKSHDEEARTLAINSVTDGRENSSFSLSPAQDTAYLKAVESGDMKTAQEMVDEAAKAAGYDLQAYHGTAEKFDKFKHGGNDQEVITWEKNGESMTLIGSSGRGFFFTLNPERIPAAHNKRKGFKVLPVFLKIKTPLVLDSDTFDWAKTVYGNEYSEFPHQITDEAYREIKEDGHDGIYFHTERGENQSDDPEEIIAFDPNQIKSSDPVTYDERGNVIPLSQRFNESKDEISFSLSPAGVQRLEAAIIAKLNKGPDERITYASRLIDRLHGLRLKAAERGTLSDEDRMRENVREAQAIFSALPPEVRGNASFPLGKILDAKTEKGRISIFEEMIDSADKKLESYLKTQYLESLTKLFDLAKPDLRQNKTLRTRLTPATQRLASQAFEASTLTPEETITGLATLQATVDSLTTQRDTAALESTPESIGELSDKLHDAERQLRILNEFGALAYQTSAELSTSLASLRLIYEQGRFERAFIDDAYRQELKARRDSIMGDLGGKVAPDVYSKKTGEQSFKDTLSAFRMGALSFHQVMEEVFPVSGAAREFQARVRQADRDVTQARIDARKRFEDHLNKRWGLSALKRQHRLSTLSEREDVTTPNGSLVMIREGGKTVKEKVTPEQAMDILRGKMKPGWETDPMAMISLRQALDNFNLKRLQDQSRAEFVRFDRVASRAPAARLHLSPLEAVYYLQLAAQEQYLPALDRYGLTEEVLQELRRWLPDEVRDIADFLKVEYAGEYDRLNPVYRDLFHMDLPRFKNYAPGIFEHAQSRPQADMDGDTQAPVNILSMGSLKSRQHHVARPRQTNALAAFWQHTETTEYFIAWASVVKDMGATFNNPDVRRALEARRGVDYAGNFYKWLDGLAADFSAPEQGESVTRKWVNNMAYGMSTIGLAFNTGSLLKQVSAGTGAMLEMDTKSAVSGLLRAIKNPRSYLHLWESQTIQQRIQQGMGPEDRALLNAANAKPGAILHLMEIGRIPIGVVDALFTTISAQVAYEHHKADALKNGLGPESAERHALKIMDRVVTRTAQPATAQDKSLIENTTKGFFRFVLIFRSDPRQKMALAFEAIHQYKKGNIGAAEVARRFFWGWAMYGMLAQLATDIWQTMSREDDDDENWNLKDYLAAAVAGPLSGLPLVGGVIETSLRSLANTFGADLQMWTNSANPLDKASVNFLRGKAVKMAFDDNDDTISDYLNAALSDGRAIGQVLATFKKEAAIIPVVLRAARDATGIISNVLPDNQEDRDADLIKQISDGLADDREERTDYLDTITKELSNLPPDQQEEQLALMDSRTARTVRDRLAKPNLSPIERKLKALPKEARSKAIEILAADRSPSDRPAFLKRMKELDFL